MSNSYDPYAYNPIAGNQSFSGISNISNQIPNLDLSQGKISNLNATTINYDGNFSDLYAVPYAQQPIEGIINTGQKRLHRVTGWAPSNYVNGWTDPLGNTLGFYFMNKPFQPYATSNTDPNLLQLPIGAEIVGAVVTNGNGGTLGGATSWRIGIAANNGVFDGSTQPPAGSGNVAIFDQITPLIINNAGGGAVGIPWSGSNNNGTIGQFNETGVTIEGLDPATSVDRLIGCGQIGGPLTGAPEGSCNMAIAIYYLLSE